MPEPKRVLQLQFGDEHTQLIQRLVESSIRQEKSIGELTASINDLVHADKASSKSISNLEADVSKLQELVDALNLDKASREGRDEATSNYVNLISENWFKVLSVLFYLSGFIGVTTYVIKQLQTTST